MIDLEAVSGGKVGRKRLEAAQAELERIRLKYGKLTSQLVLEETQRLGQKSPISWAFTWDLRSAAKKHWLSQAGHLIRTVEVRLVKSPEQDDGKPSHAFKMYSFVREPHGGQYIPTVQALSDGQIRANLLKQALVDISAMKRKYSLLSWLTIELNSLEGAVRKRKKPA